MYSFHLLNKLLFRSEAFTAAKAYKIFSGYQPCQLVINRSLDVSWTISVPIIKILYDMRFKLPHLDTSPWPITGTGQKQLGC
jgi:hypothetical protein